ncbi:MAG: MFS transporter [Betaproteobacteria bacterium]|nr:MFS transporter [Betaproteobacteria bacterium]
MIHSLRAFRHRSYRLFFLGQSLAILGNWIQHLAMSWLVYRLTGSAWLLGVTGFSSQIAILVLAPFGGLWADRIDRRKLLLWTQAAAMAPGFTLAALAYSDAVEVWHVVVMAGLFGVIMAVDVPVRQSFTPEMVPVREDLPSAIAFNALMQNGGRMIGPTIAGVLIAASGEAMCFLVNGVSKVAAVVTLAMMTLAPVARARVPSSLREGLREGIAYTWNSVPLRRLLPVVALVSFMASPYQTLMPIFAAEVFSGGAETLGFLIGAAGLGGMTGMVLLASRKDIRGLIRWIAAAAGAAGATLVAFAYSTSLALSLAAIAVVGMNTLIVAMSVSTIIQTIVDDRMRGRVLGLFTVAFLGTFPLGSLAAGAVASWIGATHTLAAGGGACMLVALWLWRRLPELRAHIRPIYARLGIINE